MSGVDNQGQGLNLKQFQESFTSENQDLATKQFFDLLDKDHSGTVTADEIKEKYKVKGTTAAEMLQNIPLGSVSSGLANSDNHTTVDTLATKLKEDPSGQSAFDEYSKLPEDQKADAITWLMKRGEVPKEQKESFANKLIDNASSDSDKNLARMAAAEYIANLSAGEQADATKKITNKLNVKGLAKDGDTDRFLIFLENARNADGYGFSPAGSSDSIIDTYKNFQIDADNVRSTVDTIINTKKENGESISSNFDRLSEKERKNLAGYLNDPNAFTDIKKKLQDSGMNDDQIKYFIGEQKSTDRGGEGGYVQSYDYYSAHDGETKNGLPQKINNVGDFINAAHQFFNKLPGGAFKESLSKVVTDDDKLANIYQNHRIWENHDLGWAIQSLMQEANGGSDLYTAGNAANALAVLNNWNLPLDDETKNVINGIASYGNDLKFNGRELYDLFNKTPSEWDDLKNQAA